MSKHSSWEESPTVFSANFFFRTLFDTLRFKFQSEFAWLGLDVAEVTCTLRLRPGGRPVVSTQGLRLPAQDVGGVLTGRTLSTPTLEAEVL